NQEHLETKYLHPIYQKILELFKKNIKKSEDPNIDEIINLILLGLKEAEAYNLEEIKKHLFEEFKKEKKKEIVSKIREAELKNDETSLNQALSELNDLLNLK
ncbi:MAG: hypothetical protein ACPL3E_01115, partial [Minisyncoccia bacterium]